MSRATALLVIDVQTAMFSDAFHDTTLQQELETRKIERLVVAGLQTEMCNICT